MTLTSRHASAFAAIGALLLAATAAQAAPVSWTIDSTQSFVQLAIPQQSVQVNNTTSLTVRIRNQTGSASTWNAGNKAFMGGTIDTNYIDNGTIQFLAGQSNMLGLNSGNYRPDPASWNGTAYTNTAFAPAVFGSKVQAQVLVFLDAAFLSIANVFYELNSGVIPIAAGTFSGTAENFGLASASLEFDSVLSSLGLPDARASGPVGATQLNADGLWTIANLGGGNRKLTGALNLPLAIDLNGTIVNGQVTGLIVATATVPEPTTFVLLGGGAIAIALLRRRTARRR
ncbi:MAG: PEP-CTERM sorting domain-containing protein [Planctomycetia bacterium]|nr:PEP-CTERM sorting domain-containing protein [Planctomycetia bacterium]